LHTSSATTKGELSRVDVTAHHRDGHSADPAKVRATTVTSLCPCPWSTASRQTVASWWLAGGVGGIERQVDVLERQGELPVKAQEVLEPSNITRNNPTSP
jgi:hypothetical protein